MDESEAEKIKRVLTVLLVISVAIQIGASFHILSSKDITSNSIKEDNCMNNQPTINVSSCPATAYVGQEYHCFVKASDFDGDDLSFEDDSDLFDIDEETGEIYFIPEDAGIYNTTISVRDNSSCNNARKDIEFVIDVVVENGEKIEGLEVSPGRITLEGSKGDEKWAMLSLKNTGDKKKEIGVLSSGKVGLGLNKIFVNEGETQELNVTIDFENWKKGVYSGAIRLISEDSEVTIPVIIEVEDEDSRAGILTYIDEENRAVEAGSKLDARVSLFTIGDNSSMNLRVRYLVRDLYGEKISEEENDMKVEVGESFVKTMDVPKEPGRYVLGAVVENGNMLSASSALFDVYETKNASVSNSGYEVTFGQYDPAIISFQVVVILGVIFVGLSYYKKTEFDRKIKKVRKMARKKKIIEARKEYNKIRRKFIHSKIEGEKREELKKRIKRLYHEIFLLSRKH